MSSIHRLGLAVIGAGALILAGCRRKRGEPSSPQTGVDLTKVKMTLAGEDLYIRPKTTWPRPADFKRAESPSPGKYKLPGDYLLMKGTNDRWNLLQRDHASAIAAWKIDGLMPDVYLTDFDKDGDLDVVRVNPIFS